jgi:hypothetical protein
VHALDKFGATVSPINNYFIGLLMETAARLSMQWRTCRIEAARYIGIHKKFICLFER